MDPIVAAHVVTVDQIGMFATLALRGEIPEDARYFQSQPNTAHVLWLVGHVALTMDRVGMSALEGPSTLPDSLLPLFGLGAKPVGDRAVYPSWEETVGYLTDGIARLRTHVAGMSAEQLARPLPADHRFVTRIPTQGASVAFVGMHSSYHLGQLSLLRRVQGLPSGSGV